MGVVLNACHTYSLAAALRREGVRYVVCWHKKAFEAGKIEVESLSSEAARGLFFLSLDGDVKGL
jgi:hypothetical protein